MTSPPRFDTHEDVMRHALQIARQGEGHVEPNPMVGAVLVSDDLQFIADGCHERVGSAHAEVNALSAAGTQAKNATLFVTLEPCNHFGRTPPCTQAVIEAGIKRVFIGATDPAKHMDETGLSVLRQAGIDVHVGLLETEAKQLIAPFAKRMTMGMPWIIAKWAMTLDGKIAARTGHSKWISSKTSRAIVHELRGRVDAILVGRGTVIADDPALTARPSGPRTALRVVLDRKASTPLDSQLVRTASELPTLIFASPGAPAEQVAELRAAGVEVNTQCEDLTAILKSLADRNCTNVLVEGGGEVLGSFFDNRHIDEAHVFVAPKIVGGSDSATPIAGYGLDSIPEMPDLQNLQFKQIEQDLYIQGCLRRDPNAEQERKYPQSPRL
ncbi:MAG: bifunctional diaminohydroxyphosphoribosylaminopyrimidine deaminase/5-amino-6-(5-phosphoribosylamino)uracil reductase RibD [Planctomycetaceae bacterium]